MSKHILIVDLPDDTKCDQCGAFFEREYDCMCNATETFPEYERGKFTRPSDCPLIPVDRVMERMRVLMREMPGGGESAAYRKGVEHTAVILRDELGLEG